MRTVVDPRFRGLLAALWQARDITQRALATETGIPQSTLSQIFNGVTQPSRSHAQRLDDALHADGQLVALVSPVGRDEDLDRIAAAQNASRNINTATVQSLARLLAEYRHQDDLIGSAAVLQPAMAQMSQVERFVTNVAGTVRPAMVGLGAQWAQFSGWLHTSLGRNDQARHWFGKALEWATEVGDNEMTATVLSYQGHVAWLGAQFGPTVGLSHAALRDRTVYPGQRAYDAYQAARGHAALGELGEARRMMVLAEELVAAADVWVGRVPAWNYYRAPWFWSLERGLAYRYMIRHDPDAAECAVSYLRAGIDGMPEDMRNADWAAEYMVHLASAYAAAGADVSAGEWLATAKQIAVDTKSQRVGQMVRLKERSLEFNRR